MAQFEGQYIVKVGILTFHWNYNWGGILQAYCLLCYLRKLGHEASFISYTPEMLYTDQRTILGFGVRSWIRNAARVFKLDAFRRCNIPVIASLEDNSSDFNLDGLDAVVVGSDVVWSYSRETRWPNRFFLEGLRGKNIRRVAYAPSIGSKPHLIKSVSPAQVQNAANLLAKFDAVSVRDAFSAEFVYEQTGISPPIVCDPAMLEAAIPLRSKPTRTPKKYILCYLFRAWDGDALVSYYKKYYSLPVLTLYGRQDVSTPRRDQIVYSASMEEWLYLFENAEFVITDSFHGTILSIQYGRPFVVLGGKSASSDKTGDLLQRLGLEERWMSYTPPFNGEMSSNLNSPITGEVEHRIATYRSKSQNFLRLSLT